MTSPSVAILEAALELDLDSRAAIVHRLLLSLGDPELTEDEEGAGVTDLSLRELAASRLQDLVAGDVEGITQADFEKGYRDRKNR